MSMTVFNLDKNLLFAVHDAFRTTQLSSTSNAFRRLCAGTFWPCALNRPKMNIQVFLSFSVEARVQRSSGSDSVLRVPGTLLPGLRRRGLVEKRAAVFKVLVVFLPPLSGVNPLEASQVFGLVPLHLLHHGCLALPQLLWPAHKHTQKH